MDCEIVRAGRFVKTERSLIHFLIVSAPAERHASPMVVGCKNCGGYFTSSELQRQKPPIHPWPLTAVGARTLAQNAARGASVLCPTCGQNTLHGVTPAASQP